MSLVGETLPCHYSWEHPAKGGYFEIPGSLLDRAREIPGVTRTRHTHEMRKCL